MPTIKYKFKPVDQVYFLGVLSEGTRMLSHITDSILTSKVLAINIHVDNNVSSVTYNILTTDLTHNKRMDAVKEDYIFKTKADAFNAAIKEIERRKAVVKDDLNKRIEVLARLITATEEAKCQLSTERSLF